MLVVNSLWIIANLLVIPGPPATIALQAYANRIVHNEVTDLSDLWQAFKRSWGVGLALGCGQPGRGGLAGNQLLPRQ